MLNRIVSVCVSAFLLAACAVQSPNYGARGTPQSLLDASAERVSFSLNSEKVVEDLKSWVNNDQPTRADLNCSGQDPYCERAEMVLHQFGIPYEIKPAGGLGNEVVLFYERLVTNDCNPRFVDNHVNPNNLNHRNFGCSVASNMVKMVNDHRQFVSPAYQDPKDAEGAVKAFNSYLSPRRR